MAGYVIPQAGHLVLSKGRPATPVVDIALIRGVKPELAEPPAPFIPPRPVKPVDFEKPTGHPIRALVAVVVEASSIDLLAIVSARRSAHIVKARHIAMWLARRFTKLSLPDIGRRLGDRDHTSVLHACRRVDGVIAQLQVPFADCPKVMAERLWSLDWSGSR